MWVWGEPADARQGRIVRLWELVLSDKDTHSARVSPAHGSLKVSKRATRGCRKKGPFFLCPPSNEGPSRNCVRPAWVKDWKEEPVALTCVLGRGTHISR